jgi:hypothetical protein
VFIAANLTPNYPLAVGGYTFPGYSALYTVVLNLIVTVVLTSVFNAMSAARPTRPSPPTITPERALPKLP